MVKKRGKKAQFYIIAAVIIVLVVISISSVVTYSVVRSQPKSINELSRTLETESPGVIRYGLHNDKDVFALMQNFTAQDFATYFGLSPDYATTNLTFVYGNKSQLIVVRYFKRSSGTVTGIGGSTSQMTQPNVTTTPLIPTAGKNMTIEVSGKNYTFELSEGQIFYFVLSNEKNGEIYVETSN